MGNENWRTRPLGDEVEAFLGHNRPEGLYERALVNWSKWQDLLQSLDLLQNFCSRLSITQFNVHRIFAELCQGDPAGRETINKVLDHFIEAAEQSSKENTLSPGDEAFRLPSMKTESAFQLSLFKLFLWEFFCVEEEQDSEMFLNLLHDVRKEAAMYASCSRLGRGYSNIKLKKDQSSRNDVPEHNPSSDNIPFVNVSWKRDSSYVGASIEPCPWLPSQSDPEGLPYYLWDRQRRQTVVVGELGHRPNYIAVSHTWGRWKTDDPGLKLEGTDWLIPQNTKFKVDKLADILQDIPFSHQYVWFDLLCIPQDRSERAKIEISRQATIFRQANTTIMWLNEIQDWKYLPLAVDWMCLKFCRNESGGKDSDLEKILLGITESLTSSTELYTVNTGSSIQPQGESLNPWFTSLWTLQEICLRPDMFICNAYWKLLTVAGMIPICFDQVVALYQANLKARENQATNSILRQPRAVTEIESLLISTGMSELLAMSRPTILVLGNRRQCLERRAEAIMAVLDATDWFCADLDDANEKDLILDTYPLEFINDVCRKIGPATFFSADSVDPYFFNVMKQLSRSQEVSPVGSLLPFGTGAPKIFHEFGSNPGLSPHPTTDTWTVEKNGCVCITKALIVSSSTHEPGNESRTRPAVVFGPIVGSGNHRLILPQPNMDLHQWIHSYEPSFPNYAVSMFISPKASVGVILKQIAPGVLVKIGSFMENAVTDYLLPDAQEVHWTVL